jgi:hypothetical protein
MTDPPDTQDHDYTDMVTVMAGTVTLGTRTGSAPTPTPPSSRSRWR